ncbi:MAG TPA: hypothetical protein VNT79_16555 [Phycisphaerae bacterium]|nr:hypothetical protein [Phycisphaerae bacterium]
MIDPDYVLLRCPHGHDLQAARTDLGKELACPVCNAVFATSPGDAGPPPPPASGADQVGYATSTDVRILPRAKFPGYTTWMLALWIAVFGWITLRVIWNTLDPTIADPSELKKLPMPVLMTLTMLDCSSFVCLFAAAVLQLVWVYRIHADALKYANYSGVSPGLALGLSLIPAFNVPWTGFALSRLASFAAAGERRRDATALAAVHATKAALLTGILVAISMCSIFGLSIAAAYSAYKAAAAQGIERDSPEMQARIAEAAAHSPILTVALLLICTASVVTYLFAVRRLEASLYARLGALPR